MLKYKRGFWMGEEAGKFILGVIAVVLLLVFAFQMAGILRKDNQLQQARYTMDQISSAIESIQDGETKNVFIESPRDWYLQSFSKDLDLNRRPVACGAKDCLCLCKATGKDECEKLGVCRSIPLSAKTIDKGPLGGIIEDFYERISLAWREIDIERPVIIESPMVLEIKRQKNELIIKNKIDGEWEVDKYIEHYLQESDSRSRAILQLNSLHISMVQTSRERIKELDELKEKLEAKLDFTKDIEEKERLKNLLRKVSQLEERAIEAEKEALELNNLFIEYIKNEDQHRFGPIRRYVLRIDDSPITDKEFRILSEKGRPLVRELLEINTQINEIREEI